MGFRRSSVRIAPPRPLSTHEVAPRNAPRGFRLGALPNAGPASQPVSVPRMPSMSRANSDAPSTPGAHRRRPWRGWSGRKGTRLPDGIAWRRRRPGLDSRPTGGPPPDQPFAPHGASGSTNPAGDPFTYSASAGTRVQTAPQGTQPRAPTRQRGQGHQTAGQPFPCHRYREGKQPGTSASTARAAPGRYRRSGSAAPPARSQRLRGRVGRQRSVPRVCLCSTGDAYTLRLRAPLVKDRSLL
jgi:hypothetical protein